MASDPGLIPGRRSSRTLTFSLEVDVLERALGHGPEGVTHQPPDSAHRTVRDRARTWAWYRFGIEHRPQPRFENPPPLD